MYVYMVYINLCVNIFNLNEFLICLLKGLVVFSNNYI